MFFKKKPKIRFIEYKPEELEARSEWLFWSLLVHLQEEIESLKTIFELDDYKWSFLKKDALFETLMWSIGSSLAVLRDKLNNEEKEKLALKSILFLEIFFPNYKDYQIIDIISNYIAFAEHTKNYKKLREELESYFIERINKLFGINKEQINEKQIRDLIFMRFPQGWILALDAFTSVSIKQINMENQMARQTFRDIFVQAQDRFKQGKTEEEKEARKKWEKDLEKFNKIVGEAKEAIDYELGRRRGVEKSMRKFLLQMNPKEPLNEQIIRWIKKEGLSLSDSEIAAFVDKASAKYRKL